MEKVWILCCFTLAVVSAFPRNKFKGYHGFMHINEKGSLFDEEVDIDEDNQLIFLSVPQHRDVDESKVIIDLVRNLTVRYVPTLDKCFVEVSATLEEMENSDDVKAKHSIVMEDFVDVKEYKKPVLTVHRQLTPSFKLIDNGIPDYMASLCPANSIYFLKPLAAHREKRAIINRVPRLSCSKVDERCSLETKSCHYVRVQDCSQQYLEDLEDKFGVVADEDYGQIICEDGYAHVITQVSCCSPCCADRVSADPAHPFCEEYFPPKCTEKEEIVFEDLVEYTRQTQRDQDSYPTTTMPPTTSTTTATTSSLPPWFGIEEVEITEYSGSGHSRTVTDSWEDNEIDDYDMDNNRTRPEPQ